MSDGYESCSDDYYVGHMRERARVLKILHAMIAEHEDPWSDSEAHKRALLYDAITRIESGEP